MDLLKCTVCKKPLTMEIRQIRIYDVTDNGSYLVKCIEGGLTDSFRYEEELRCPHCGKEFRENIDWHWENGRITLKQYNRVDHGTRGSRYRRSQEIQRISKKERPGIGQLQIKD